VIKHLDGKNVKVYQKTAKQYKKSLPYHKSLPTPPQLLPLFALYHDLLNLVPPMCSTLERPNPEVSVINSTNIVDILNVGLTHPTVSYQNVQDGAQMDTQANKPDPELTHAQSAEEANNVESAAMDESPHQEEGQQAPPPVDHAHASGAPKEMNMHESLIHDVATKKMQEESVSVIPSNANGSVHHDEPLVASDPVKELVLEMEKMNINGQLKPPMQSFVTAVGEFTAVNGRKL
jgi:hypothetical protein